MHTRSCWASRQRYPAGMPRMHSAPRWAAHPRDMAARTHHAGPIAPPTLDTGRTSVRQRQSGWRGTARTSSDGVSAPQGQRRMPCTHPQLRAHHGALQCPVDMADRREMHWYPPKQHHECHLYKKYTPKPFLALSRWSICQLGNHRTRPSQTRRTYPQDKRNSWSWLLRP